MTFVEAAVWACRMERRASAAGTVSTAEKKAARLGVTRGER